jgi:imidazolonepropionase-like amidohydrolase
MYKQLYLLITLLFIALSLYSQTFISNITIIDVEEQALKPNQTVTIDDSHISSVKNKKKVSIPSGSTVIDGTGKYLIPGLVDAHIHFFQNGGLYTRPDAIDLRKYKSYQAEIDLAKADMEKKLRRYLQNGITTVIDVGANYYFLDQRNTFEEKTFAPDIFITGPLLTTYEPEVYKNLGDVEPFILTKSIEDGIKGVQAQLNYSPDFIKVWYITGADGLSIENSAKKNLPIVKAIIDEAHKHNLKVAVHATQRITAELAVENGADLLVHSVDDEVINSKFIALLQEKKTVLCPTLIVRSGYLKTFGQNHNFSPYELRVADPYQLGSLLDLRHIKDTSLVNRYYRYGNSPQAIKALKTADSISRINLKLLSDAGITIVTGTDAGNIGTLHASSYIEELKAMAKSGMSNWEILKASTLNGATLFDHKKESGKISPGKKANLVLLNANPIENLENLKTIYKVVNKGKIYTPETLLEDTPSDLAQRQLNAYNMRNIDAFLEPYDDLVEVYKFPNQLLYKGKATMRQQYSSMFDNTPNLHCELKERIVQGNIVIDKERVRFGEQYVEAIAIYHVENKKIKRVYFIQ